MPLVHLAVFDIARVESDEGEDGRIIYQQRFSIGDTPDECAVLHPPGTTPPVKDLTGLFMGFSALAPHFGASDRAALRFVCSDRSVSATLNCCAEVWIAISLIETGTAAQPDTTTAGQALRDVNGPALAHFLRAHLRSLEAALRATCGAPTLWGGNVLVPKPIRKAMKKAGIDSSSVFEGICDFRLLPPRREMVQRICDDYGVHFARLLGGLHTVVRRGSDACALFFGFPTVRSSVKIALGTGGRATVAHLDLPVVLLIDGMLAIGATTDAIARSLCLTNYLFPDLVRDGNLFYSPAPKTAAGVSATSAAATNATSNVDYSRLEHGFTCATGSSFTIEGKSGEQVAEAVRQSMRSTVGMPEVWRCVSEEAIHDGLEHLAIGLVPLAADNGLELEKELRAALKELVSKSVSLTQASSIISLRGASRFRFNEPSMQFSWSAPGYGSASSTLFPGSGEALGVINNNNSNSSGSSGAGSGGNHHSHNNMTSPKASHGSNNINNSSALVTPYSVRHLGSSMHREGSIGGGGGGSTRGSLTSPGHPSNSSARGAGARHGVASGSSPRPTPVTSPAQSAREFTLGAAAISPSEKASLMPLLRAACNLTCRMAQLTERANDAAVLLPKRLQKEGGGDESAAAAAVPAAKPEPMGTWNGTKLPDGSSWFGVEDSTYKVDDFSWATIKVVGGRAVGVMVLSAQPSSSVEPLSIEDLIIKSNAVSILTFDDTFCTTLDV